jgi:zinc transporter ZupT
MITAPMLIQIFAAFAIALAGGALSAWMARTHEQLCAFISLGAGTLLGVAVCGIAPECLEALHWWQFTHRLAEFATAMMLALSIHCVVDGLALAAGNEETRPVGLSITFAICVHKFPEGLALGALLLGGGYPRGKMLWLVAAVESTTILGGLLGWFVLRSASNFWLALALANAGGGFLYLAAHAVLGEILKHHKKLVLTYFAAGFGAIAVLILFFHLKA